MIPQQTRQAQQVSEPSEFNRRELASRQVVPGAGAPVGPANHTSLFNSATPENEWRARFDDSQHHIQRRNEAFISYIDIERRERQRQDDIARREWQRRDDAERRERQVREFLARQEAREAAIRQEAREIRAMELEKMKIALEMKKLEAGARTRDDARPRRRRSRSRSVERHQHTRGATTRRSRSPSPSRLRAPTTSHRLSVRPPDLKALAGRPRSFLPLPSHNLAP